MPRSTIVGVFSLPRVIWAQKGRFSAGGMRVSVLPETGTASKIVVMPTWRGREPLPLLTPVPDPVWGTFVRTYGTSMVISAEQKEGPPKEVSVPTDDKTRYLVDGEIAKLADVKPGMRVTTTPLPETPRHPALLTVEASSKGRSGRLVRVDGKNVVLKTASAEAGGEVAVATDENTRCILLAHKEESGLYEPRSCRLSELTAGMPVKALPETGTASKIIAHQLSRWAARPASKPAATAPAESQPSASGRDRIKQRQTERLDKT